MKKIHGKPRLAVIFGDQDLLRITPLVKKTLDTVDLKISPFFREHLLLEFVTRNGIFSTMVSNKDELSYHSPKQGKKAEFHLKELGAVPPRYLFTQNNITSLSKQGEFPVPLFRLDFIHPYGQVYNPNPQHQEINLAGEFGFFPNSLEVYFAHKDFDYRRWSNKWPNLSLLWTLTPIDYLIDGVNIRDEIELYFLQRRKLVAFSQSNFSDFCLLCKPRYLPNLRKNRIRFYNNVDFIEILGFQFTQLVDEQGDAIDSSVLAYRRDLAHQRALGYPEMDIRKWELIFKTIPIDEMVGIITRKIFQIPQVNE